MASFAAPGIELAVIAIFSLFLGMILFMMGHTLHRMYKSQKSADVGDVDDDFVLKGGRERPVNGDSSSRPSLGKIEQEKPRPQKSYDFDTDDADPADWFE